MAVKHTTNVNVKRDLRGFMNILSSMAAEWLLIFLLFVDAALSYLLTKFAHYCELQTPCLLCSRLDHIFGNEKPEFYRSLFCSNHRIEISSLISCHIHGKLADSRAMCEECLMSVEKQNKTKSESYGLLAGKLGVSLNQCGFTSPFLNKNIIPGSLSTWTCSCCNKIWKGRSNAQRFIQLPVGFGTIKPSTKPPLPRLSSRGRLSRRDSFMQKRDKILGPVAPLRLGNTGVDPLSHVGYTELKINSDSDSEFPFSDDDDRASVIRENPDLKEVLVVQRSSGVLPKSHSDNLAPVKQTQQASDPGPSLLDQCIQLDASDPHDAQSLPSDDVFGHGLGELNWEQATPKPYHPSLPELISLDDVPPSSNVLNVSDGVSASKPNGLLPHNSALFMLSELVLPNGIPPSSDVMEIPVGVSPEKYVNGTRGTVHKSACQHAEVSTLMNTTIVVGFKADHVIDTAPSMSNNVDRSDECKLSDGNKEREVSGMLAELPVGSNSAKVHAHGIGPSLDDRSPRLQHDQQDELKRTDASSSNGIGEFEKSPSLERNNSGYQSLDGSSVSEIESEGIVDRLKRQIEHDRRSMGALYKELEEERNASEIAANQAMAMITRLQGEKASLHMEALQYLRMMEEQAEYDMEALQKANDLLAGKEKEVQDLEAELEFYRINYPDEEMVESLPGETSNSNLDDMRFENNGVPHLKNTPKMSEGSDTHKDIKTLLLDFEGEKLYISQCLKKLERYLHQVSGNRAPDGVKKPTKSLTNGKTQTDHKKEEYGLLMPKNASASNASVSTLEGSGDSIEDNSCVIKEDNHVDSDRQESFIRSGEMDLIGVENQILHLNGRLEALEADRGLFEHSVYSLRNGCDGLRFIKEIAHQLQELRKFQIEKICSCVP
ncbi:lateral signaling target-like protein [Actinidia rufa]|uniref:Lateral signaling target-like protein n=1 Tax=Actinidia rufa TaxID=165716 RepID=A0A7J0FRW9_9ERIC|nr:lateral signaling target-like protein [Actinidia rufa]